MILSGKRDVPAAGMLLLLPGAGRGMLSASITQPAAHSPLVVLTDLILWKELNPTPSPPHGCSWWAQGCSAGTSFHIPSPAPSNRKVKNWSFCWFLGWFGHSHVHWHGHPGTGGCLEAQHCPGLERAGIRHPPLPLPLPPGGTSGPMPG